MKKIFQYIDTMKRLIISFSLICLLACSESDEAVMIFDRAEFAQIPLTPGFHRVMLASNSGGSQVWTMWVPAAADTHAVPLVIALHPAAVPSLYRSEPYLKYFAQPGLQSLNAMIVAPDLPADNWLEKRSEDLVISLITCAKDLWPIDPDFVVITGYSLGGIGTWYYADKYPELFRAAVPIASQPVGFLSGQVPHYIIQGQRDEAFGVADVQKAYNIMKSKKRKVELVLPDLSHSDSPAYVRYLEACIPWISE